MTMDAFYDIEIYSKDVLVAKTEKGTKDILYLGTDDEGQYPITLFGYPPKERVTYHEFTKWLETRVFPDNRVGVEDLLKEIGLKVYSVVAIAQYYEGRLISDNISVKWVKPVE